MKQIATLLLFICITSLSHAQWSNTTNQFYDSLHMPVSVAPNDQRNAIVLKSYPDSGYFVIWLEYHNTSNGTDIYAQKFDKSGKRLWAANGVPVIAGADNQTYAPSSNADYR